jgi:site-specific recombinase XerD
VKRGQPSVHPLRGPELRALWQLRRHSPSTVYLFVSERGGPLTSRSVRHIILRAGEAAGLPFPIHPQMLRHACGFYLANKGIDTRALQQYLGHCNIQHTVRYTALSPQRFTQFWDD